MIFSGLSADQLVLTVGMLESGHSGAEDDKWLKAHPRCAAVGGRKMCAKAQRT